MGPRTNSFVPGEFPILIRAKRLAIIFESSSCCGKNLQEVGVPNFNCLGFKALHMGKAFLTFLARFPLCLLR